MDEYQELMNDESLYNKEVIDRFARPLKSWALDSMRKRELALRHITCCINMCNMEKATKIIESDDAIMERIRKRYGDPVRAFEAKRRRIEKPDEKDYKNTLDGTSEENRMDVSVAASSSEDKIMMEGEKDEDKEEKVPFRFEMVRYMPAAESIMLKYAKQWNCAVPSSLWDLVDKKEQKFVKIAISTNKKGALNTYYRDKSDIPLNSAIAVINPNHPFIHFEDMAEEPIGKDKVLTFLLSRKQAMEGLKIVDTELKDVENLQSALFCSDFLNELREVWENDFLEEVDEKWDTEDLHSNIDKVPRAVKPRELLKLLSNLKESEREGTVTWKGKILPEGWTHNEKVYEDTDAEMVQATIDAIGEIFPEGLPDPIFIGYGETPLREYSLLQEIIEHWNESTKDTFNFINPKNRTGDERLERALGIGEKGKHYEPDVATQRQKEFSEIPKLKYHTWYDETLRRLEESISPKDYIPFPSLLEMPMDDNHPIAKISEQGATDAIKVMLQSKCALYASKLTNLYSRLGGSYSAGVVDTNKSRASIAIFPIYAPIYKVEGHEKDIIRMTQGFVIRGPQHVRNGTDKIGIITVEMMNNSPGDLQLVSHIHKAMVYVGDRGIIVVRQNSVMKEETSYGAFTINAMFSPINTLGGMTMENPTITQDCDMMEFQSRLLRESGKWFLQRFIEGVLFASIGNSRDEGYFTMLRKMFMMILAWRREELAACWDITSFCNKTNECLIDNPISMHFHRDLLRVIEVYSRRRALNNAHRHV